MARRYRCPLWFARIEDLIRELRAEGSPVADRLEAAAYRDQHDNHHDAEYHDGCEHCDRERAEKARG